MSLFCQSEEYHNINLPQKMEGYYTLILTQREKKMQREIMARAGVEPETLAFTSSEVLAPRSNQLS